MTFTRNPQFMTGIRKTAIKRTDQATEAVRDHIRARMDRSGDGVRHSGSTRRASSPGESLVSQSGEASESMQTYPAEDRGDHIAGAAGTDLYRIVFAERGTASMAPRPTLFPALLDSRDDVMRILTGGGDG